MEGRKWGRQDETTPPSLSFTPAKSRGPSPGPSRWHGMVAVERGKQHFSSPLKAVVAHPPSSSTTLLLITSQGWDSHKRPQNSDMGMEWICGIWYLNLWNHYNLGNACSCFFSCLHLASISYSSFWKTKHYSSLPYQSDQGYRAIPIWLKWGILTVFHIFLEQLGTVITQLSPETTHEMGSSCVRQETGSLLW